MQLSRDIVLFLGVVAYVAAIVIDPNVYPGPDDVVGKTNISDTPNPIKETDLLKKADKFFEQCMNFMSGGSAEEPNYALIPNDVVYLQFLAVRVDNDIKLEVTYVSLPGTPTSVTRKMFPSVKLTREVSVDRDLGMRVAKRTATRGVKEKLATMDITEGVLDMTTLLYDQFAYRKNGVNSDYYPFAVIWKSSYMVTIGNAEETASRIQGGWTQGIRDMAALAGEFVPDSVKEKAEIFGNKLMALKPKWMP